MVKKVARFLRPSAAGSVVLLTCTLLTACVAATGDENQANLGATDSLTDGKGDVKGETRLTEQSVQAEATPTGPAQGPGPNPWRPTPNPKCMSCTAAGSARPIAAAPLAEVPEGVPQADEK